jgi:Ca-activated chloride channel homolog
MMRFIQGLLLSAFVCLGLSPSAEARQRTEVRQKDAPPSSRAEDAQEVGEGDVVRVATSLVRVPLSARDREGRYVSDLTKEDFRVYDNGAEQQIAHFGDVEEPLSVVLLIDVSCSIKKPEDTKAAALAFVEQLRPADSVLPIAFGRNIYALLTESTRDHALLRERIKVLPDNKQTPCDGGTRLGDAVEFVIHRVLKGGKGWRAVILLSDGRDSKLSKPGWFVRTLEDVSELGVPFYSIHLSGSNSPIFAGWPGAGGVEGTKLKLDNRDTIRYIDDLAAISGGRSYPEATGTTLRQYFMQIGEELRHQYVLAYSPGGAKGKRERRTIKVRINRQNVAVRARESYIYVPATN